MLSVIFKPPSDLLVEIGERAKDARLVLGWTRRTLSVRSGIPESTIKRFEHTGLIGTAALIDIAIALDMFDGFEELFSPKPLQSITQITTRKRKRGSS